MGEGAGAAEAGLSQVKRVVEGSQQGELGAVAHPQEVVGVDTPGHDSSEPLVICEVCLSTKILYFPRFSKRFIGTTRKTEILSMLSIASKNKIAILKNTRILRFFGTQPT